MLHCSTVIIVVWFNSTQGLSFLPSVHFHFIIGSMLKHVHNLILGWCSEKKKKMSGLIWCRCNLPVTVKLSNSFTLCFWSLQILMDSSGTTAMLLIFFEDQNNTCFFFCNLIHPHNRKWKYCGILFTQRYFENYNFNSIDVLRT